MKNSLFTWRVYGVANTCGEWLAGICTCRKTFPKKHKINVYFERIYKAPILQILFDVLNFH
jgi:hypothetical protein